MGLGRAFATLRLTAPMPQQPSHGRSKPGGPAEARQRTRLWPPMVADRRLRHPAEARLRSRSPARSKIHAGGMGPAPPGRDGQNTGGPPLQALHYFAHYARSAYPELDMGRELLTLNLSFARIEASPPEAMPGSARSATGSRPGCSTSMIGPSTPHNTYPSNQKGSTRRRARGPSSTDTG